MKHDQELLDFIKISLVSVGIIFPRHVTASINARFTSVIYNVMQQKFFFDRRTQVESMTIDL